MAELSLSRIPALADAFIDADACDDGPVLHLVDDDDGHILLRVPEDMVDTFREAADRIVAVYMGSQDDGS